MDGINVVTGAYNSLEPIDGLSHTVDGSKGHPDGRCFLLDANGDLLTSDDGGVWKRTLPESSAGRWLNMGGNIRGAECISGKYDPISKVGMCGTQDNGVVVGLVSQPWYVLEQEMEGRLLFPHQSRTLQDVSTDLGTT